jgi:hypothetical protein
LIALVLRRLERREHRPETLALARRPPGADRETWRVPPDPGAHTTSIDRAPSDDGRGSGASPAAVARPSCWFVDGCYD